MKEFDKLLGIAKRKAIFDETSTWSNGAETYLAEIKNEVDEVIEEIPKSRKCYLENKKVRDIQRLILIISNS